MSSSDLVPSAGRAAGGADFEPLCPIEQADSSGATWRPLIEDQTSQGAFAPLEGEPAKALGEEPGSGTGGPEGSESFAAGYELGREETRADVQAFAESLVKSIEELAAFRAGLRRRYERELLELALGVARKVVRAELREHPEIWLEMIRDAVRQAVDREEIRVRVSGPLATFLTERLPEMRAKLDEVKELVVVEDPALTDGACVIETRFGELDVGVDTQIDQMKRALTSD